MAKFITRRFSGDAVRLVGRAFEDVAQELQELLEKLLNQITGGIPAGFNDVTPAELELNAAADPGAETEGWAAADHVHALDLLLSLKGHILSHNGTSYVVVALGGAPNGHVLTADAASAAGFKWSALPVDTPTADELEQADFELVAALESLAMRDVMARTFR